MAGYSATPLAKKLGLREGHRVRIQNTPANYLKLLAPLPDGVLISSTIRSNIDVLHYFTAWSSELESALPRMMRAIQQDGVIWISWPRKSSGVASTVTENVIRSLAFPLGLVDVKVCAVDETWSGLKLVIRRRLRK
jgi:Protein of unknown function (DUF3052)